MPNTTRQAIIKKLRQIPGNLETSQNHAIDAINKYLSLTNDGATIYDFINETPKAVNHRYSKQIYAIIAILNLLENTSELIEDINSKIERL